jgi:hypothetical protein
VVAPLADAAGELLALDVGGPSGRRRWPASLARG